MTDAFGLLTTDDVGWTFDDTEVSSQTGTEEVDHISIRQPEL